MGSFCGCLEGIWKASRDQEQWGGGLSDELFSVRKLLEKKGVPGGWGVIVPVSSSVHDRPTYVP